MDSHSDIMRAELCHFSGLKIYPGHGINHCKADGKVIRMISSKTKALYHDRKNPRKLRWTILYRRKHKKGISQEASVKRRVRRNIKATKAIGGLTTNFWPKNNKSQRSDRSNVKMPSVLLKKRRRLTKLIRNLPVWPQVVNPLLSQSEKPPNDQCLKHKRVVSDVKSYFY